MMPSQKFEELAEMCGVCQCWLDDVEQGDDPYVKAAYEMLAMFEEMIDGDREWETCFQVKDRIERMYPGADL